MESEHTGLLPVQTATDYSSQVSEENGYEADQLKNEEPTVTQAPLGRAQNTSNIERRCTMEGCTKQAQAYCLGYCIQHAKEHNITRDPKSVTSRQCKMEGCKKYARRKGLCSQHGKISDVPQPPPTAQKICSVENCGKWPRARGLCTFHMRDQGFETRRCKEEGCSKGPCRKGYCMVHARARGYYSGDHVKSAPPEQAEEVEGDPGSRGWQIVEQTTVGEPAEVLQVETGALQNVISEV